MADIRVFAFAQGLDISPGRFVGRYATEYALKVNIGILEGLEFVEVITHSGSQVLFAGYALIGDDRAKRYFCKFCTAVEYLANFRG